MKSKKTHKIMVIGGAGYIGSHMVKELIKQKYEIIVIDNLSNGHEEAIDKNILRIGDFGDYDFLKSIFNEFTPDIIIHFAAFIEVGISMQKPTSFYKNNISNSINLLSVMDEFSVNKIIFSSTAALYGLPKENPITEQEITNPINPYGRSKFIVEQMLKELSNMNKVNYIALRYFNASGASIDGDIGEAHSPETHLIPLILKVATGERENIKIFGTNYPTSDGTAIRDYIHVDDLVQAHILSMNYLLKGGESDIFNCGYGKGYSVKEIIEISKKITKKDIKVIEEVRREGDAVSLVADSSKIRNKLGWTPKYDNLKDIISSAWNWEINRKY